MNPIFRKGYAPPRFTEVLPHFVKTGIFDAKYHKLLTKSFGQRLLGDYDEVTRFISDEVSQILEQAWDFLKTAKDYLASQP